MSFLDSQLLAILLPFVALPVIIHFINRMRFTPMDWAAMEFLFRARRSSTKFAKLREILILLFRCLAIFCLGLALARPQSGGWLGWALSGSADTVIIVLDRSSSLGVLDEGGEKNKLEKIVEMVKDAAKSKPSSCRFVLLDGATGKINELAKIESLADPVIYGVTDTTVSVNYLMNTVNDYIKSTNPGNCEVWLCGDLQKSNWQPESSDWQLLNTDLNNLKTKLAIRLLALSHVPKRNLGITVNKSLRYEKKGKSYLDLHVRLNRNYLEVQTIPVTIKVNNVESVRQIEMNQEQFVFVHTVELPEGDKGGFGMVSLPADQNPQDNNYYYAYGSSQNLKSSLLVKGKEAKILGLAIRVLGEGQKVEEIADLSKLGLALADSSMLVINGENLSEEVETKILDYVDKGGQVIVFPPLEKGKKILKYLQVSDIEKAKAEEVFGVGSWEESEGLLEKSRQGESLPIGKLRILQRQVATSAGQSLAMFSDGKSLLDRYGHGRGAIYYFAGGLAKEWSDFYKGAVLLPVLKRLSEDGAKMFSPVKEGNCYYDTKLDDLEVVLKQGNSPFKSLEAGVYKKGENLFVLNRPLAEDNDEVLSEEKLGELFKGLEFSLFNDAQGSAVKETQSELFSLFIVFMLIFFIAEGFLTLRKPELIAGVKS